MAKTARTAAPAPAARIDYAICQVANAGGQSWRVLQYPLPKASGLSSTCSAAGESCAANLIRRSIGSRRSARGFRRPRSSPCSKRSRRRKPRLPALWAFRNVLSPAPGGGVLSSEESAKLLRLARTVGRANEVFEVPETALDWLKSPNSALAGKTPISLLDTDIGAESVLDAPGPGSNTACLRNGGNADGLAAYHRPVRQVRVFGRGCPALRGRDGTAKVSASSYARQQPSPSPCSKCWFRTNLRGRAT